jgi:hypothetical protein
MRFKHLQTKHVDCHFIPEGMIFLSELLIGEMTVADEVDSPLARRRRATLRSRSRMRCLREGQFALS